MDSWWTWVVAVAGGLLLLWLGLLVALWLGRPDELRARDLLRLLPDLVRLLRRLAADPTLPRGVRVRLWLLLGYLLMPIDLVPDFIPVIGYADDAALLALVLTRISGDLERFRAWEESRPRSGAPSRGGSSA